MPAYQRHLFGTYLAQVSRAWRSALDRRLAEIGLSQARWLVLLHLSRFNEPPAQRQLAESVGVEGPTLARLLDNLEQQGLVQRIVDTQDRRAKKLILTDNAKQLITTIEDIAAELRDQVLQGISEEEQQICQSVHTRILANIEKNL